MTVRVGGIEAPKIKVAGVDANRVMVGTGQTAVEAWPGTYDVAMDFGFPSQDQLKWAPITGFDSRTSSSSRMAPGFVYNDMFVAGDNSSPTYNTRLIDHQIDGDNLKMDVVLGDNVNTKERPSYLVLASNPIFTRMLILEFGSNGVALRTVINGSAGTPSVNSAPFSAGDTLTITWQRNFGNRFFVRRNNSSVGSVSLPESVDFIGVDGRMYVGFGVYSTSSTWSTRIQRIQITSTTTYKRVLATSETLARITIPRNTWTEVCRSTIPTGGTAPIRLTGAKWPQASSSNDRKFRIKVDGVVKATTADEGGRLSLSSVPLLTNSSVTVEALAATSNSGYREVSGGVLQVGDSALFV